MTMETAISEQQVGNKSHEKSDVTCCVEVGLAAAQPSHAHQAAYHVIYICLCHTYSFSGHAP